MTVLLDGREGGRKEGKVKLKINREEWHGIVKVRSTKAPHNLGENNKGKKSIYC